MVKARCPIIRARKGFYLVGSHRADVPVLGHAESVTQRALTGGRRVADRPVDAEPAAPYAYVGRRRAVGTHHSNEFVPDSWTGQTSPASEAPESGRVAAVLAALEPVDQTTDFADEATSEIRLRTRADTSTSTTLVPVVAFDIEPEPTTYVTTATVGQPTVAGKRRAVKHAGSRGPLFKSLPSVPVLAGVAALAISIGGVLAVPDVAPASGGGYLAPASALSGSSGFGSVGGSDRGEPTLSRDSDRSAREDAAQQPLQAAANAMGQQRDAALVALAADAEKQAAIIAKDVWQYPLGSISLTARFGQYGLWSSYHTGLDFDGNNGDPIYSVANGVVTETGYAGAYGNRTIVTLEDGTEIWYCHQTSYLVQAGDVVRGGETIGTVGSTGNVTGSHLHLEVRPGGGDPVDPYLAMQQHGLFR
jgi:murein DD-endopeptidase MepM/ murein hydrolase activator NlpD